MQLQRLILFTILLVPAGAAVVGCRSSGALSAAVARSEALEDDSTRIWVIVQNQGMWEVNISAQPENGIDTRVGSVLGNITDTLVVPRSIIAQGQAVRFLAKPVAGGRTIRSQLVYLSPGDEIRLIVPLR